MLPPYFDHDAFMHHALSLHVHVGLLDAPAQEQLYSNTTSFLLLSICPLFSMYVCLFFFVCVYVFQLVCQSVLV